MVFVLAVFSDCSFGQFFRKCDANCVCGFHDVLEGEFAFRVGTVFEDALDGFVGKRFAFIVVSLFAEVLGELDSIDKLAIGVSLNEGGVGIDGFFGVGFGESCEEGDGDFVFEFFVDKIDDVFGDGGFSGFGFAGSGAGFHHDAECL